MRILITGSNGFVGSRLMWVLEAAGHEMYGIDRSPVCHIPRHPNTIKGDIRYYEQLSGCPAVDLIIHCAASKHDFGLTDEEYYSDNEYGTEILMKFARERQIGKIVYYSTVSVYGHQDLPCDETGEFLPNTVYGASKLAGEKVIERWLAEDPAREAVFLRPTIIYGPHSFTNLFNLMNMMHRKPWIMIGTGDHVKSLVALENLVDMTVFAIGILKPGLQAFNCIDKPYITVKQLMEIISAIPGFKMPRNHISLNTALAIGKGFDLLGKVMRTDLPVNSDRLKKLNTATDYRSEKIREMGYEQRFTTENEIRRMAQWYLQEGRLHK